MVEGIPPPGTPFRHPHSKQRRPARAHAVGPVLGPHTRTNCTRDTRVAEPRPPAPEGRRLGEGQRLTPDAPHNPGRPPPPGTAPHRPRGTQPPQGMQAKGTVLGPHTHTPATTACGWRTPTARPVGGQFGEGERLTTDAPHNGRRHPPGNALPPPPQRATPARKGARCGAGAWSPRPHRPHPGHTGRGTLAARSRGRAAGGGTAPDTRRPTKWWTAPPPGTPFHHPHSKQRRPARAHAVGPVLGPHARTDRTRDTRVAEPRPPAPEGGRLGEEKRLTPHTPHNGGRPPPPRGGPPPPLRHAAPGGHAGQGDSVGPPHPHTRDHSMWVADPNSPPSGRAVGGGTAPDLRRPSQWWKAPPRERPSATPTASNAGPQGRTLWGRCWVP